MIPFFLSLSIIALLNLVILHSTTPNYENVLENIDFSAHSLQSPHKKQPPKHSK